MDKVFYFNINYICDNKCIFCLSHNTNYDNGMISVEDIIHLDYDFSNSRIILNGGECTLCNSLDKIISFFNSKEAQVVMYTNGRRFKDFSFSKRVIDSGISRITIPIHGEKRVHNMITRNNSYEDTIEGIRNLISLKNESNFELEIKFILSNEFMRNTDSLEALMKTIDIDWNSIDTIVISNVVSTELYKKDSSIDRKRIVDESISFSRQFKIKLEDIDLCKLDCCSEISESESFKEFYFFDPNHKDGIEINYKKETPCISRGRYAFCKYCNSVMDKYQIVSIDDLKWSYIME